jgi:ribosomal protein S18 acetylase RimI-like enzyme
MEFRNKSQEELAVWLPTMWENYINERRDAGEDIGSLRQEVATQHDRLFPQGKLADDQHVMTIVAGENEVGTIWLGRPLTGLTDSWFIYGIEIDRHFRGQGYGRAAMETAEGWALGRGAKRLALNVFATNAAARGLYESLGYQVFSTSMFKDLEARELEPFDI